MRHFDHVSASDRARLFAHEPQPFDRDSDRELLAVSLGATLYVPATRPELARTVLRRAALDGVTSMVVDLEDALSDREVEQGLSNLVVELGSLCEHFASLPLLFVRVREPQQVGQIVAALGPARSVLFGFVIPKFTAQSGEPFLAAVRDAAEFAGVRYLVMPVLESAATIHVETRRETLAAAWRLLDSWRELVLAVRIGATDLSGHFGLRRDRELTIYDVRVVADAIADIVNVFGRTDGSGFTVCGPVWEYFVDHERMLKPLLRRSPFQGRDASFLRDELLTKDIDGLLREVLLDRANGLTGKTIIHPSHAAAVHALSVAGFEEHADATALLSAEPDHSGASASGFGNKMNEGRPHHAWALKILTRAQVFGVADEAASFVDFLAAARS